MVDALRIGSAKLDFGDGGLNGSDAAGFSDALLTAQRSQRDRGLATEVQWGRRNPPAPRPMPGGGTAYLTPYQQLLMFRWESAYRTIQRLEPNNRELSFMARPNTVPGEEWITKLEAEARAVIARSRSPEQPLPGQPAPGQRLPPLAGPAPPPLVPPGGDQLPPFPQSPGFDAYPGWFGFGADGTPYSSLRRIVYDVTGWHGEPLAYVKRDPAALEGLRRAFDQTVRGNFCRNLARNHQDRLRAAGLTNGEIEMLSAGRPPAGYEVHHIRPLDDGGTNDFGNLILIRIELDHRLVTSFQNSLTQDMRPGQMRFLQWPVPPAGAVVWPAAPQGGAQVR